MGRKGKIAGILFCLAVLLLGACGRREETVTEYGMDGFVYVPQKININNLQGIQGFQVAGGWLYYSQRVGEVTTVKKIAIDVLEDAAEEWNYSDDGTVVLSFSGDVIALPDGTLDSDGKFDYVPLLDQAIELGRNTSSSTSQGSTLIDPDKEYCSFNLWEYMVDKNGNLTYLVSIMAGKSIWQDMKVGTMLCRQNADGSPGYRLFLPYVPDFTVDGSGRTYLLGEEGIHILDESGKNVNLVVPGGYQYTGDSYYKSLYGDGDTSVYYMDKAVYEIQMSGNEPRLVERKGMDALPWRTRYYAVPGGGLLYTKEDDGILYEWDNETALEKKLLRWQDSNMLSDRILAMAPVGPDRLIVSSWGLADGMFLLTKTPVEELPQRQSVVMACLYPEDRIWEEVMEFNMASSEYRIILERYGAVGYMAGDDPEAEIRLDAALVSGNPPDILVLDDLDILKYSNRQGLEDLAVYMEESSLNRGDFLENILDGCTVEGRLVCIPGGIYIDAFYGRRSQLEGFDSWTMEDVYELAEQYPDADLFYGKTRDYMLKTFCAPYYLEEFIDWEEGECDFESEEFRKLVLWIEENFREEWDVWLSYDEPISRDVLLAQTQIYNFVDPLMWEVLFGEEIRMVGFPGAEGGGRIGFRRQGAMGISSNSRHKDGAWSFLEFHLMYNEDKGGGVYSGSYIPILKSRLTGLYEFATMERYKRNDENGNPVPESDKVNRFEYQVGGETIGYTCVPRRLADELLSVVENLDISPRPEVERLIVGIVAEEIAAYYSGHKPLEEVTEIIQSRVGLLVQEQTLE